MTSFFRKLVRAANPLGVLSFAAALALVSPAAHAADFPSRPITLEVPFAPGGSADIVGRVVAAKLSDILHVGVVVSNKAGAAGIVGTTMLKQAAPDGYTIGLLNIAHAANPALHKLPYDSIKDFAPIALVAKVPSLLLVNKSLGVTTLPQFIALARANPGKLDYGSLGIGSSNYLPMQLFMSKTGTKLNHVPYSNGGVENSDLVGGQIQITFLTIPSGKNLLQSGKLIALAVCSLQRQPSLPDVPTLNEAGVPGFEFYDWHGIAAPAKTPPAIIAKLNAALTQAMQDPIVKQHIAVLGAEATSSTPQQFGQFMASQVNQWTDLLRQAGVKPE